MGVSVTMSCQEMRLWLTHHDLFPISLYREPYRDSHLHHAESVKKSELDLREMVKSYFLSRSHETGLCGKMVEHVQGC